MAKGKELQDDFGLGWYDYGARFYDPIVPHFLSIDPMAEKFSFQSSYVYAGNNPIKFIDVNGKYAWKPNGDGTWTAEEGDGAETLAKDANISREEAYRIMEEQGYGTYVDKRDGVVKSAVDPGDIVDVNSKEIKKELQNKKTIRNLTIQNNSIKKRINRLNKSIDSMQQEINASKEAMSAAGTDGSVGTKSISFYFGLKVNKQKKIKSEFERQKKDLEDKYEKNKSKINSLKKQY